MPDWNILITERLGKFALAQEIGDEVVAELASHLEKLCNESCARGAKESEAIELALSQVGDWQGLGQEFTDAKNQEERMNERTKRFWLPGLATLTASMLWLMILQHSNWNSERVPFHAHPLLTPYLIWLFTQPLFGAVGAYLSRRAGGRRVTRLAAGIFPSLAMLGLLVFVALTALFVERNPFVWKHPGYFALIVFPWAVFPAIALLVGVVPFLKMTKVGQAQGSGQSAGS